MSQDHETSTDRIRMAVTVTLSRLTCPYSTPDRAAIANLASFVVCRALSCQSNLRGSDDGFMQRPFSIARWHLSQSPHCGSYAPERLGFKLLLPSPLTQTAVPDTLPCLLACSDSRENHS